MDTKINEKVIAQIGDNLVELQGEELTAFNNLRQEWQTKIDAEQAEKETKAIEKAALLTRLGITDEEAKLLFS